MPKKHYLALMDDEIKASIVADYQAGIQVKMLSFKYRIPKYTVSSLVKKAGVQRKAIRGVSDYVASILDDAAVERISGQGFSAARVAKVLKVSPQIVRKHVKENPRLKNINRMRSEYSKADYLNDWRSDAEIADYWGVSRSSLVRWKRGNQIPIQDQKRYPRELPFDDRAQSLYKAHYQSISRYCSFGGDESIVSEKFVRICSVCSYLNLADDESAKYIHKSLFLCTRYSAGLARGKRVHALDTTLLDRSALKWGD
jgi:hypothetical protein